MEGLQNVTKFVFVLKNKDKLYLFDRNENVYTFFIHHSNQKKQSKIIYSKGIFYKGSLSKPVTNISISETIKKQILSFFKKEPFFTFLKVSNQSSTDYLNSLRLSAVNSEVSQKLSSITKQFTSFKGIQIVPFYKSTDFIPNFLLFLNQALIIKPVISKHNNEIFNNAMDTLQSNANKRSYIYDFSTLKDACNSLIEEHCNLLPALKLLPINKNHEFDYEVLIERTKLSIKKMSDYEKKHFLINFIENSIYINNEKSNKSRQVFMNYFQLILTDVRNNNIEYIPVRGS